jgi:plastocyanin
MRHVRQAVKFCGRWQPVPPKEAAWLLNPPKPMFHDTDIPRFLNRPAPPAVKAGDTVRFTLACEVHELPVMAVDGHLLLMEIRLMSREVRVKVPTSMVKVVEEAA